MEQSAQATPEKHPVVRLDYANLPELAKTLKRLDDAGRMRDERAYNINFRHTCFSLAEALGTGIFAGFFTPHAVMLGDVQKCWYNPAVYIASERVMRTDGQDGMRVMQAFINWASDSGATAFFTTVDPTAIGGDERMEKLDRIYQKMGFEHVAHIYKKSFL